MALLRCHWLLMALRDMLHRTAFQAGCMRVDASKIWQTYKNQVILILLMRKKSGEHQLRWVVYPIIYGVCFIYFFYTPEV